MHKCPSCNRKFHGIMSYPLVEILGLERIAVPDDRKFPIDNNLKAEAVPQEVLKLFESAPVWADFPGCDETHVQYQGWTIKRTRSKQKRFFLYINGERQGFLPCDELNNEKAIKELTDLTSKDKIDLITKDGKIFYSFGVNTFGRILRPFKNNDLERTFNGAVIPADEKWTLHAEPEPPFYTKSMEDGRQLVLGHVETYLKQLEGFIGQTVRRRQLRHSFQKESYDLPDCRGYGLHFLGWDNNNTTYILLEGIQGYPDFLISENPPVHLDEECGAPVARVKYQGKVIRQDLGLEDTK